jgi:coenzyme F420-reducing hydrogenase gamma subunit
VLAAFLGGRKPRIPSYSVCVECKLKGNVCVPIAAGRPCLGPVTQAGCGALCPSYGRGCYGCFGPHDSANTDSLTRQLAKLGMRWDDIVRVYRTFNAGAPEFEAASNKVAAGGVS